MPKEIKWRSEMENSGTILQFARVFKVKFLLFFTAIDSGLIVIGSVR
jgi:hypothetical protein